MYVDNDVQGFISYISELKLKRGSGKEGPITIYDLEKWKKDIGTLEKSRMELLERYKWQKRKSQSLRIPISAR